MKIEIKDITIRNFLSYGNLPQRFPFETGLNIITGKNGQGKSGLSDALSFALFGKVLRDINQNDLINWRNRKDCLVAANFTKGETEYRVVRGLKPYFLEIYEDGVLLPKVGKRDSQMQLEEILGFSFNTYSNLIYTNINFNLPILKMSKGQKREFIEQLFDIEVFTKFSEKCKQKIRNIERRKGTIATKISSNSSMMLEYSKIIEDYINELSRVSSAKEDLQKAQKELTSLTKLEASSLEKLNRAIKILEEENKTRAVSINDLQYTTRNYRDQIIDTKNKMDLLQEENKCPTCESKINPERLKEKYRKRIKDYEEKITKLLPKIEQLKTLEKNGEESLNNKKEERRIFHETETRIKILSKDVEYLKESVKEEVETKKKIEGKIEEYEEAKKRLDLENMKLREERDNLDKLQDYLDHLKDRCKDEEIKQYAISSNIPLINKATNEYLAEVGFNFYIEIDRFIDARIKGPGIFGESCSNLSGGESKSVDLSLMMAFHDIARLKAKNYIDILFLDEILDSSVDGVNIQNMFNIIRKKQIKDKLKVYIISHRPEINDLEVNRVVKVEKEGGYSRISF